MFTSAPNRLSALAAIGMTLTSVSTVTEARHWRHHNFYGTYGQDRGVSQDQNRQLSPRTADDQDGRPPSNREKGFGPAIDQIIHTREQKSLLVKTTPFDQVTRMLRLRESQKTALEEIKTVAKESADVLALTCAKNAPTSPTKKLEALVQAINSMMTSLTTLQPAMAKFYVALDEEQKAKLVVGAEANTDRSTHRVLWPDDPADAEQNSVCHQWAATFKSWPIRQIDERVSLSDVQHAALYELTGEMYRAAADLIASCPRDHQLTPMGRTNAEQKQLKALRQSVDRIQPLLTNFERVLNDRQKIGLESAVNMSSRP
jgi:hypothetical protein